MVWRAALKGIGTVRRDAGGGVFTDGNEGDDTVDWRCLDKPGEMGEGLATMPCRPLGPAADIGGGGVAAGDMTAARRRKKGKDLLQSDPFIELLLLSRGLAGD